MNHCILAIVFILSFSQHAYAGIREDSDMLATERKQCLAKYKQYATAFRNDFESAITSRTNRELVDAYEDMREVTGEWSTCWAIYMTSVLALFDGEVKFSVVPYGIEELEKRKNFLRNKVNAIVAKITTTSDAKAKSLLTMLIEDSTKEFLLVDKYVNLLTSY